MMWYDWGLPYSPLRLSSRLTSCPSYSASISSMARQSSSPAGSSLRSGLGLPWHQGRSGFSDLRWGPPIPSRPGPSQLDWSLKRIRRMMTLPCGVPLPEESSPLVVPSVSSPGPRWSQLSLDALPPGVLSLFTSFASHGQHRSLMPSSSYTLAPNGRLGHGVLVPPGSDPGADRS